jgi:hypothetical protein
MRRYTGDPVGVSMADPVEPVRAVGGAARMDNLRHIKLSEFWPQAPQLWFSQTECRFAAHGMADEFAQYCLVVGHSRTTA